MVRRAQPEDHFDFVNWLLLVHPIAARPPDLLLVSRGRKPITDFFPFSISDIIDLGQQTLDHLVAAGFSLDDRNQGGRDSFHGQAMG